MCVSDGAASTWDQQHRKAKALKDRALEESKKEEEIRKQRLIQEAQSALDKGTG